MQEEHSTKACGRAMPPHGQSAAIQVDPMGLGAAAARWLEEYYAQWPGFARAPKVVPAVPVALPEPPENAPPGTLGNFGEPVQEHTPGNSYRRSLSPRRLSRARAHRRLLVAQRALARTATFMGMCLRKPRNEDGRFLVVRDKSGTCGVTGLERCGLAACPYCGPQLVADKRARAVASVKAWDARGSGQALFTNTKDHGRRDTLKAQHDLYISAHRYMVTSAAYKALCKRFNLTGDYFTGVETPFNWRHGWGYHGHEDHEVVGGVPSDRAERRRLERKMSREFDSLWRTALRHVGGFALHGIGARVSLRGPGRGAEGAAYVVKGADEVVSSSTKRGRGDSMMPWELLDSLAAGNLPDDEWKALADVWVEYVDASKGWHPTYFSAGCADEDSEGGEHVYEPDDDGKDVLSPTTEECALVLRNGLLCRLLEACEDGQGAERLASWVRNPKYGGAAPPAWRYPPAGAP